MNPNRNPGWRAARAWLAIALIAACAALAGPPARAASFSTLEIATKNGVHIFSVEMATTEDEKSKGLMYRRELADGKGMLFDFTPEQEVSMWMKNTYISLDMIFIRADGTVHRVEHDTEPMSEKIINSRGPVSAVLELRAGEARRLGIEPGSRIEHPAFKSR